MLPYVQLPEETTHPAVLWTVIATACLSALILAAARLFGPVSEAFEQRRRYKQRAEDARIIDLSSQVDHLAGRVFTLESNAQRQDSYLVAHAAWDHEMTLAAIRAGLEVPEPPPLRPPLDL